MDPEVALRSAVVGGALGLLLKGREFGPEFSVAVGALVGYAYDQAAFWLKGRLKVRRRRAEGN